MVQQARNLLMDLEDVRTRVKFFLHDRDASLTAAFDEVFRAAGARIIRAAIQAPRMNSIMERVGRQLPPRAAGPNPAVESAAPDDRAARVRGLLRHPPAHRALRQAAPLRQLPDGITDLDQFRVQRRDRAGSMIHEYRLVA